VIIEVIDPLEHFPAPLALERPLLCDEMDVHKAYQPSI
jgi:hypothetical protein